jgi:hypothetical protein
MVVDQLSDKRLGRGRHPDSNAQNRRKIQQILINQGFLGQKSGIYRFPKINNNLKVKTSQEKISVGWKLAEIRMAKLAAPRECYPVSDD